MFVTSFRKYLCTECGKESVTLSHFYSLLFASFKYLDLVNQGTRFTKPFGNLISSSSGFIVGIFENSNRPRQLVAWRQRATLHASSLDHRRPQLPLFSPLPSRPRPLYVSVGVKEDCERNCFLSVETAASAEGRRACISRTVNNDDLLRKYQLRPASCLANPRCRALMDY